jgi:transposase InsO family protein
MVDGQEWVVDSGSSNHLTGNPGVLHDYVEYSKAKPLGTAVSSEAAFIVGEGTVCMEGTNGTTFWIKDVGFVPGLTQNLYSMVAGSRQNLALKVNSKGEFISMNQTGGKSLCSVIPTKSQYLLDARALEGNNTRTYYAMLAREGRAINVTALLTLSEDTNICELWHRRMGHPSPQALSRLVKEQMAEGITIPRALLHQSIKCRCECCILGKMAHLPFPLSDSKTSRPLELVHVDLCGPLDHETNAGERYFLAMMDDFSKYAVVFVMAEKSEAKDKVVETLQRWMTQMELSVKILRSDGGKEFVCNLVSDFCKSKGIVQQITPRYTPESNGKIERFNRTIKEKVRCLLIDSRLPVEWWGFALEHAAFLRNCLPASGRTATPYELFLGTVPDLSGVRVFGCKAYVRLEKADKALTKLGPQCETGVYLGGEADTKAYRILIGTEIRVSRHVRFSEEKFLSTGKVDGLMPMEHEEYDEDPDCCEEDYDLIRGPRRVDVHLDPFLPSQIREDEPGESNVVEPASAEEVVG